MPFLGLEGTKFKDKYSNRHNLLLPVDLVLCSPSCRLCTRWIVTMFCIWTIKESVTWFRSAILKNALNPIILKKGEFLRVCLLNYNGIIMYSWEWTSFNCVKHYRIMFYQIFHREPSPTSIPLLCTSLILRCPGKLIMLLKRIVEEWPRFFISMVSYQDTSVKGNLLVAYNQHGRIALD